MTDKGGEALSVSEGDRTKPRNGECKDGIIARWDVREINSQASGRKSRQQEFIWKIDQCYIYENSPPELSSLS